jgi:two-component system NtrC family response regulator
MNDGVSIQERGRILIVDDDQSILSQLKLAFEDDCVVHTADNSRDAWRQIQKQNPDLITLDLGIENENPETGFTLLEKCLAFDPLIKIIMITGNDTDENALRAIEQGAVDLLGKPVDLQSLRVLIQRGLALRRLELHSAALQEPRPEDERLGELLGRSREMQAVFRLIKKVAPTDITVLVLGESGTGKEMVAREIHRLSRRSDKPFVSISCGAIPENLLESELFGHEKGAYTNAHTARPGRLELADGGTVFLDEIGDMPMLLQVKLLRFLQEREIERVGGRRVIPLDVRVLAATNRDLSEEVSKGRFREDLYYRLSVIDIHLPPLKKKFEDILFLAEVFLTGFAKELNRGGLSLSRDAKDALRGHAWPGNVRELEHRIQRAALLASGRVVHASDLELTMEVSEPALSLREARDQAVEKSVVEALRRTQGNVSKAAQALEVSRPTLHDLLRKLEIDAKTYRAKVNSSSEVGGSE